MLYNMPHERKRKVVSREHKANNRVLQQLNKSSPKYLQHILQKNETIINFAKSTLGGIDLLDQPMCEHCEKPGAWHTNETCYCFSCGKVTKEPITLYEYLANELKLSKEDLDLILNVACPANTTDGGLQI